MSLSLFARFLQPYSKFCLTIDAFKYGSSRKWMLLWMTWKMLKCYSLPSNVVKIFFYFLFPLLGEVAPTHILYCYFFIFMEHKYFFPFQQGSIFLYFFQLVSSPRSNVSADRSTKTCSVHFLTDDPVWRTSVVATTMLREINNPWPVLQQRPASPMVFLPTTCGVSGLLSLQERRRRKRFAPTDCSATLAAQLF